MWVSIAAGDMEDGDELFQSTHLLSNAFMKVKERTCLTREGNIGFCTSIRSCYPALNKFSDQIYFNMFVNSNNLLSLMVNSLRRYFLSSPSPNPHLHRFKNWMRIAVVNQKKVKSRLSDFVCFQMSTFCKNLFPINTVL